MPQISLTDFVDIVSKAGRPKATKVQQVKTRPDYEPAFDFYKPLREHIAEIHRTGADKKTLGSVLNGMTDQKKIRNYPELLDGYKKWWGRKQFVWFAPPRDVYTNGGFDIILNPELGLEINGERHVIKLYFKSDALTALRIDLITNLMEQQLRSKVNQSDKFAVLDVRNAKLFPGTPGEVGYIPMVNAEIAYINSIWNA